MNRISLTVGATLVGLALVGSIFAQEYPVVPSIPSVDTDYILDAPEVPSQLRTFYVNADAGDDTADGHTFDSAWRTLQRANGAAQPGDTFLLTGTFRRQRLRPTASGTDLHRIVYAAAEGEKPVLDADGMESIVQLDSLSHIVIDGLELTGGNYIVQLWGKASHIWMRNLYVHDSGGVLMKASSDNRVEDCRFERIGSEARNTGDAIHVRDGSHRNVFVRNTFAYMGHSAVGDGFRDSTEASCLNNVVAYSDLYNPWANGITFSGKAHTSLIEHNHIHGMADGTGPNYARSGISLTVSGCVVRYNDIHDNGRFGLTLEGRPFNGYNMDGCDNHIYHNTFWNNAGGGVQFFQRRDGTVSGNVIENNIFWNVEQLPGDARSNAIIAELQHSNPNRVWRDGSFNKNIVRHNILPEVKRPVTFVRKEGTDYLTLGEAESRFDGWTANRQVDPQLVDPANGDFTLQPNSPAIDAGCLIPGVSGAVGSSPDIGAHETP